MSPPTPPPIKIMATPQAEKEDKADAKSAVEEKTAEVKPEAKPQEAKPQAEKAKESQGDLKQPTPRRPFPIQTVLIVSLVSVLSVLVGVLATLMLSPSPKLYQGYLIHESNYDSRSNDEPYWSSDAKRRIAEHDKLIRDMQGRKP